MTDVHSKETRSYNMSQIKSKNTEPEMHVRKYLWAKGYRYKLHDKDLPGSPDIVLPKYKSVLFVNGCFFHGHKGCRHFVVPKTNTDFWLKKINSNINNDEENSDQLNKLGWKVIVIWECEVKNHLVLEKIIGTIVARC